ncbi:MAG: PCRF domain-containing protein, partial [Actinomycetes bacterium]
MAAREFELEIKNLDVTLAAIEQVLNLPKLMKDAVELEAEASAPDLWDDPEKAQVVTSRLSRVQVVITRVSTIRRRLDDVPILIELAREEGDEKALLDAGHELDDVTKSIRDLEVQT